MFSWHFFTLFVATGLQKKERHIKVYLSSSSLLGQIVEKIEQWLAFLDNNLSTRHRCSRSALWGSAWSHDTVLLQLRSVSRSSLNSLTAKLYWTRFWWASSARSVHRNAYFISVVTDIPEVTETKHTCKKVEIVAEIFSSSLNVLDMSL